MTELIFFLFAVIGLTSIVVDSELFREYKESFSNKLKLRIEKYGEDNWLNKRLRKFHYMLYCYQCMGFCVGVLLGFFLDPVAIDSWWRYLAYGGCTSYFSQLGMALFNYLNVDYGAKE